MPDPLPVPPVQSYFPDTDPGDAPARHYYVKKDEPAHPPRPVDAEPGEVEPGWYDEGTGQPIDLRVGWSMSPGCRVTFGFEGDRLHATVSTSDVDQRAGITRRTVTREQVAAYARSLLALVESPAPDATSAEASRRDWAAEAMRVEYEHRTLLQALKSIPRATLSAVWARWASIQLTGRRAASQADVDPGLLRRLNRDATGVLHPEASE